MRWRAVYKLGDGAGASKRAIPKQHLILKIEDAVAGVHAALAGKRFRVDVGAGVFVITGQQALH